ncbi:MAG: M61 family metallopeptidase [Candidatus Korobacteraceae bacterium]
MLVLGLALGFVTGPIPASFAQQPATAPTDTATQQLANAASVAYTVSLQDPARHMVRVGIQLPPGAATRELQLPVWNALYQVRDFAQYITGAVTAVGANGQPLPVRKTDSTTWQIANAAGGAAIQYDFFANESGPFGTQLDGEHAFFNLAWFLMYPVGGRHLPVAIHFNDVPQDWKIATAMPGSGGRYRATSYDHLVDSPVEISALREFSFIEGGANYRFAIHGDPADYDSQKVQAVIRRVVSATVDWMQDRPFDEFLFLIHFLRGPPGGGMEHSYSTAIEFSARAVRDNPESIASLTTHEFFHLWNVKRIRPVSLEPVDYTRENFTPALWFSEGTTNAISEYLLLRAGFITEKGYLNRLGDAISILENRPARLFQSVEQSSVETWLDKYPFYTRPERSISYYNKGEVVSVLLDLALREASNGQKSLRDVFHWLNQNYAKQGRFFPDSNGVRQACEAVAGADFEWFFRAFIAGTEPLPYDRMFQTVGLRLQERSYSTVDLGVQVAQGSGRFPVVSVVEGGSAAESAGVRSGDSVLEVNGRSTVDNWNRLTATLRGGETIRLRLSGPTGTREVSFAVFSTQEKLFELVDADNVTAAQRTRRAAWLNGQPDSSR